MARPEHWAIFDNYFTELLGGLRVRRMGYWLENSPAEGNCEFCVELEDGTFVYTTHDYDEMTIEVLRPNGTRFCCDPNYVHGRTKAGLELYINRYDTFDSDKET